MFLSSIIDLISHEEEAPLDLDSRADLRHHLAERLSHDPSPIHSRIDHVSEAANAVGLIGGRYGIDISGWSRLALDRMDTFLDAVREASPSLMTGTIARIVASWIGEYVRINEGLRWTDDSTLTDGRIVFDPASAASARASCQNAPSMARAIDAAIASAEIRTLAAA